MTQMDQTGYMPIFGSDLPEYVKHPEHLEALRELERIVLRERLNRQRHVQSRDLSEDKFSIEDSNDQKCSGARLSPL